MAWCLFCAVTWLSSIKLCTILKKNKSWFNNLLSLGEEQKLKIISIRPNLDIKSFFWGDVKRTWNWLFQGEIWICSQFVSNFWFVASVICHNSVQLKSYVCQSGLTAFVGWSERKERQLERFLLLCWCFLIQPVFLLRFSEIQYVSLLRFSFSGD